MFPHIEDVNRAVQLIKQGQSGEVKPFKLYCEELSIILQQISSQEQREIMVHLFKPHLLDQEYEKCIQFSVFDAEKRTLMKLL